MDFLSLVAYLKMDKSDYEKGLKDSESLASKAGHGIASVLGTTAKVTAAGIAATTTAVAGLVSASVKSYAEFEQLEGGVETLFKNSADEVMKYADNAYKSAGLSANEYMETVTSFSASLLQSLGGDTKAAADKADQAIVDMADNANKMGSSMESIQNAYQGFAKQNYTMLDNLKLGYGGTKEEMARLLEDAEKISGIKYNLNSYADVVDAIHVIQVQMGIAGTTAEEAEHTISGSLSMLGSSWKNLVTGITNPNADIGKLINDVVESAKAAVNNLVPAISQALKGVVSLVRDVVPVISKELPGLLNDILPQLIDAGIDLFSGLVDALPTVMKVLFDQLPKIIEAIIDAVIKLLPMIIELGGEFLMALADGLLKALPKMLPKIVELIEKIVNMFTDPTNLIEFVNAAVQIIVTIANGLIQALPVLIPAIAQVILALVEALTQPENLMLLIETSVQLVLALVEGLFKALPDLLLAVGVLIVNLLTVIGEAFVKFMAIGGELIANIILGIASKYSEAKERAKELIVKMIDGIKSMFSKVKDQGREAVEKVKEGFREKVEGAKTWGRDLIQNFINGLLAKWNDLKNTVRNIASSIKDFLGFSEPKLGPLSNFHTYAPDMMELFAKGIDDNKRMLLDTVSDAFNFEDMVVGPNTEVESVGRSNGSRDLYSMLETVVSLLSQMSDLQVVLDTGVLVGQTAPQMNKALGTIYSREKRNV